MYVTDDGGAHVAAVEPGRARRLPARQVPGVRPVRAQGRAVAARARSHVPAEPLGPLSQRRPRRELDRHRQRRPLRLRLPDGDPSGESRLARGSCRSSRTSSAARPKGSCASTARATPARRWEPLANGLPQEARTKRCCATRSRSIALDPAGVYFGTRSGKLFGSADEGESWSTLADGLPPVISVKAAASSDGVCCFVIPGRAAGARREPRRGPRRGTPRARCRRRWRCCGSSARPSAIA